MQFVSDLQEMMTAALPLFLIAGGVGFGMIVLLSVLAVAHNAFNND